MLTDILSPFQLHWAPFGGGLAGLLLLGIGVLAVRIVLKSAHRGRRAAAAMVATLIGLRLALGVAAMTLVHPIDFNPVVEELGMVGLWQDGSMTLDLRLDHSYTLGGLEVGRWAKNDGDILKLSSDRFNWHVIRADRETRLIHDPGDPDAWDGNLGFYRDSLGARHHAATVVAHWLAGVGVILVLGGGWFGFRRDTAGPALLRFLLAHFSPRRRSTDSTPAA